MFADYRHDLLPYGAEAVAEACTHWRRRGKPYWPKVSELIRLIEKNQATAGGNTTSTTTLRVPESSRIAFAPIRNNLKLEEAAVKSWFHDAGLAAWSNLECIIEVPTRFIADWITTHYLTALCNAVIATRGPTDKITIRPLNSRSQKAHG